MKLKQLILFIILLIASCWISFSLAAQPTSGLKAYWPMNGNFTDNGPNAINGTNSGATATTNNQGVANKAMAFSNPTSTVAQFATHPVNANVNFPSGQDFSVDLSIYINGPVVHAGSFYDNGVNYGGYGVWMWNSNGFTQINFNYKNANIGTTNGAINTNTWYHICCLRAAGILKIYINGVLNASVAEGSTAPSYIYTPRFGTLYYQSFTPPEYQGLNGKMDELRIYNRALTQAEITQLVSVALPVRLGDFTAVRQSSGIMLNWETISEQNTSHFEVERSAGGTNFIAIGRINASGNSNDKQYYNFTDRHPLAGTNFYRLKFIDLDGAFTFSKVIAIKNNGGLVTMEIFPNPVSDLLQVQWPSQQKETVKITITDAGGRTVFSKQQSIHEGQNAISIPVQQFSKGTYYIILDNTEGRQSKSFLKQ